jgi:hypothetical protein
MEKTTKTTIAKPRFRDLDAALRLVRGGGGAGLDILIGNTGGDRLIETSGGR